jgi:hypothetical protein
LLAFGLLFYLLSQQGWEILAAVSDPTLAVCPALFLMMVSRFAVAGRWHSCCARPLAHLSP